MSTPITQVYQDSMSGTVDTAYTIPAGPWVFERWSAGAQFISGSSSKVELFWDQVGDGSDMTLLDAIYTSSETYAHTLDNTITYESDGNSRIVIRRSVLSGATAREIYAQWQGFIP